MTLSSEEVRAWDTLRESSPWTKLANDGPPFLLDIDSEAVTRFNGNVASKATSVQLGVMPEPFVGSPTAPIWLLNLNPGFDEGDLQHDDEVRTQQRTALDLSAEVFWLLDARNSAIPGYHWWRKRLRAMIDEHGLETILTGVFCVELFPYHSRRFDPRCRVPSQNFTFEVVRRAVELNKGFIFMRAKTSWLTYVPELANADTTSLRSNQSVYVTRNNLRDPDFIARRLG